MKDQKGTEFVEKDGKFYTCTSTVAITDSYDIKDCKVIKKLAIDEVFVAIEGPVSDDSGISRVKGKSTKDDTEGWVTIKGNAGTTYAKVNEKLYTVRKEVALQQTFKSDSGLIRNMEAGEAFEVLEGPREERFQPANRVKVRAASDRAVGWLTMKPDTLRSWRPSYKYVKVAPLYTAKGLKESVVREAAVGEMIEVLETPVEADGAMWMKVQLKKDSVVGWTPTKDDKGARLVVPATQ